jgi:NIPSNAP
MGKVNRRKVLSALAASPLVSAAQGSARPQYYELRHFQLRNGTQPQRATEFFTNYFMPAAKRAGANPVGAFSPVIGERSPFALLLLSYAELDDIEKLSAKMMADANYVKGLESWDKPMDPGYVRIETSILRAFSGHPQMQLPPETKDGHYFEMRVYESNSEVTLRRKVEMFNRGEIHVFQKVGANPLFFAEAIAGDRMPHLTYMLTYPDWTSREKVWSAFSADPEWAKLRAMPGFSDSEIVCNISNSILRPTAYSQIR